MADFAHDSSGAVTRGKQFEEIHLHDIDYNRFDLSFDHRITFNSGPVYPVLCKRGYPGDKFHCSISALVRAAPLAAPAYQKYDIYFHGFAIPIRLLWSNFREFRTLGNGTVPMSESSNYVPPALPRMKIGKFFTDCVELGSIQTLSALNADPYYRLWDSLNLPSPFVYSSDFGTPYESTGALSVTIDQNATLDTEEISSLPFRAYYLVWYEYYRDQNCYDASILDIMQDGDENDENLSLFRLMPRAWEKDYFTSCLPSAQRGAPVSIPLGDSAPVYLNQSTDVKLNEPRFKRVSYATPATIAYDVLGNDTSNPNTAAFSNEQDVRDTTAGRIREVIASLSTDSNSGLIGYADISAASAVTIESLRVAARTQEWLEKQARCGNRYNEFLLSHWGVISSDARLQRPTYIGGGKTVVSISEVMNQTSTDPGSYVGKAISSDNDLGFGDFEVEEDCYIMVMMSLLPRTSYSQGIPREWRQFDPLDWVSPEFANLGEQEVKVDEIFHTFDDNDANNETFGYQARYQECKYSFDEIHGEFRHNLAYWHASRIFENAPKLSEPFISCNPSARTFNIVNPDAADHWYADIWINLLVDRKLPEFNVPQL